MRYAALSMAALFAMSVSAQAGCNYGKTAQSAPQTTVADSGNPVSTPVKKPKLEVKG